MITGVKMNRTILLTGGGGFVAGNIISQNRSRNIIEAVEQREVPIAGEHLTWHILDLQDSAELRHLFQRVKPDVIIHTAAISDIDYCEAHQEIAESVNVGVARTLVDLCAESDVRLIYFSSDSIFNGQKGRYVEEDIPEPLNFYGRTKVAGEKILQQGCRNLVIIRPSLITGLPLLDAGNSFLWRLINELKQGKKVPFPKEEIRSPVDAVTLSRAVLELAENDFKGILHLAGNDTLARFEIARQVVRKLGYPPDLVVDKKPQVTSGRAPRPRDVSLNNAKARSVLKTPMLDLEKALDLIIENKGDKKLC